MERDILPICVTTYEALCICAEQDVEVIYILREAYEEMEEKAEPKLRKHKYKLPGFPTRNGLLFAKKGIDLYQTGIIGAQWIF